MKELMREALLEKYIQLYYDRFSSIVSDLVSQLKGVTNTQVHSLVELTKNPAYASVEKIKQQLLHDHERLWHAEYPDLYHTIDLGFGRLKNLAEAITKDIDQDPSIDSSHALGMDLEVIHFELIRQYFVSAVKSHLGSK
jgi:hypothetical protein